MLDEVIARLDGSASWAPVGLLVGVALGLLLVTRTTGLSRRAEAMPLRPSDAFVFGVVFGVGRAAVLLAAGYVGARVLPEGKEIRWSRLDRVVGILFLVAAAYYLYRVLSGQVITSLPGEPGGGLA